MKKKSFDFYNIVCIMQIKYGLVSRISEIRTIKNSRLRLDG